LSDVIGRNPPVGRYVQSHAGWRSNCSKATNRCATRISNLPDSAADFGGARRQPGPFAADATAKMWMWCWSIAATPFVHAVVQDAVVQTNQRRISKSDRIDRIVTHPIAGIPIFLALMWVVFKVTIDVSAPYLDWIDLVMTGPITHWAAALLSAVGLGGTWAESLAVDGVIAGVGGVLVFVPVMLALYLVLAVLEDCGYMARAAMVMDRLMRKVGLQGKSFLPMVVGFGCSVPAIYATRTLENRRDRILTGLLVPFMSCSARLPVYVLFAAIFFPQFASLAIFAMYLLGILIAIIVGLLLNHTLFKSPEQSHFIMELPPYRLPTARNVWRQMWERTSSFIHNAWTIILVVSIVLWFLLAIPAPGADSSFAAVPVEDSIFGAAAGAIAPVFAPLGFGSWQASGSLLTGFVAKEVVIATMAQVYHVDALGSGRRRQLRPPSSKMSC
jgi:ferrous iron transport protein B